MSAPASIGELFSLQASRLAERTFLHWRDDEEWRTVTYGDFAERVSVLARALLARGIQKGDRVAILSENRPEWFLVDLACLSIGVIDVPIYSTSPAAEVRYVLERSGARLLFLSDTEQRDKIEACCDDTPALTDVFCFEAAAVNKSVLHLDSLLEQGRDLPEEPVHEARAAVSRDDTASILFTSGTTGDPKGVMLSHGNFLSNCEAAIQHVSVTSSDRTLSFLPLSHSFERTVGHYALLSAGGEIAYASCLDRVAIEMKEVQPTIVLGVPRFYEKVRARILSAIEHSPVYRRKMFHLAMRVGERVFEQQLAGQVLPTSLRWRAEVADRLVFSRLRERVGGRIRLLVSGGAPLDPDIVRFFNHAGLTLVEGYGLTETAPVVACNQPDHIRAGSVGKVLPGVEVHVAEDGELLVRGPNVMQGYFQDADATAAVLEDDGTFHTGDVGHVDDDGYLFITDRKKDLIITAGGKNVSPAAVECRVKRAAVVADLCLIGEGQPYLVALLVPDDAALKRIAEERGIPWTRRREMLSHPELTALFVQAVHAANQELSPPEQIKKFTILDEPFSQENRQLTPTLKVRRPVVEARYDELIHRLYAEPSTENSGAPHLLSA